MKLTLPRLFTAALALSAVACSEVPTESGDTNLSTGEVRSLALGVTAQGTSHVENIAWSAGLTGTASFSLDAGNVSEHPGGGKGGPGGGIGGLPIWGPHRPGVHGTTTTTTDRTGPCPQGGTMRNVTKITSVVDTVARTGKVTTESTATPDRCAFTVDSLNATLTTIANPRSVITITGAPSLVTTSSSSYSWAAATSTNPRGALTRGATSGTQTGSFTYTTNDGRSGTCRVDLKTSFNPENRTHTITGTFCDKAINLTHTAPQRGAHGPGGGHRR